MILPGFPRPLVSRSGIDPSKFFSTTLFTGTGAPQSIVNQLNLAGEGGLVWYKTRTTTAPHLLLDSERGANYLSSSSTLAEAALTGFTLNSDGFYTGSGGQVPSGGNAVSWSFLKAAKFFDVISYTGNGVAGRQIPHNLQTIPGLVVIKHRNSNQLWPAKHKDVPATQYLRFDDTGAIAISGGIWNNTEPTLSHFTVGNHASVNGSTAPYIAYLFAHDPDGIIHCGNYIGNGSASGPIVDIGWTPQYLLVKSSSIASNWSIYDNERLGWLYPNINNAESSGAYFDLLPNGFQPLFNSAVHNAAGQTYVFMAIRAA